MRNSQGLTLLELMVSLSIVSALLIFALPSYQDFIIKMRVDNEIHQLQRLLLVTRNNAINSGSNTILCPLEGGTICNGDWNSELSIFIDLNDNQQFDSISERLILTKEGISHGDKLLYAKFRDKVTYAPTGNLSGLSNGTFRYCPTNKYELARGIILAISGRFYLSTDSNLDGIEENRSGKPLDCE
ncbi:prepilin-type N-terminal cleavage/methylation domain-containing protein [Thalassotalea sp. M1531]|uniref:Type II secretion system protein H n=1 Tax=Thalassotalea algicola TaxID=2716224 RepID=A0A7Y0LB19_9GAMM|nr:GspH/FimT family pseudopilin [Thalassotalea algicola]NMP30944.1 prepilin-type N-terminal cleavage/methylation domain-containing protein [Thalassotalea algicola]